jgi:hypothetical protein
MPGCGNALENDGPDWVCFLHAGHLGLHRALAAPHVNPHAVIMWTEAKYWKIVNSADRKEPCVDRVN